LALCASRSRRASSRTLRLRSLRPLRSARTDWGKAQLTIEVSSGKDIRQRIAATRRGGVVSIAGVYAGFIHGFMIGDAFDKG